APRVRQLYARRAVAGAGGRARGNRATTPGAGDVRAGGPPTPAARAVSRVPGAEPHLHRRLLAALRLGGAGRGGVRAGGRVPAGRGTASAALHQGTRAGARAASGRVAPRVSGGRPGVLQALRDARGTGAARGGRPGGAAQRAL